MIWWMLFFMCSGFASLILGWHELAAVMFVLTAVAITFGILERPKNSEGNK